MIPRPVRMLELPNLTVPLWSGALRLQSSSSRPSYAQSTFRLPLHLPFPLLPPDYLFPPLVLMPNDMSITNINKTRTQVPLKKKQDAFRLPGVLRKGSFATAANDPATQTRRKNLMINKCCSITKIVVSGCRKNARSITSVSTEPQRNRKFVRVCSGRHGFIKYSLVLYMCKCICYINN